MSTAVRSDQQTYEAKLQRLEAQVRALQEQLQRAQRLATLGTMTAMVAHEFNNILTPIINYAQLARQNPRMVEKAIARAAEGGRRASDICGAILGLARGQASEPSEVNLSQLIARTLSAMARDPKKDGIDLIVDVPDDLVFRTSPVELQHVVLNLLMNARAAVLSKPAPRIIRLLACRDADRVILSVSDNGPGIAPEHFDHIFEPFFTTKSDSQDLEDGHGLGLALCRQIVEAQGGQIIAQSTPGQGATFTLFLPA